MTTVVKMPDDAKAWFLNEDAVPYEYEIAKQTADFPNDFHFWFETKEAAEKHVGRWFA